LLGLISEADYLIVIDAIKDGATPGTLHRLEGDEIPRRILAKNSLHEIDLLEALALCQALEKVPRVTIIGIEPYDIKTLSLKLSPIVENRLEDLLERVIHELRTLGVEPKPKSEKEQTNHVPRNPC